MLKNKSIAWLVALALILNINSVRAADISGDWSIDLSMGPGIILAPDRISKIYPSSIFVSGDISYMVNEYFGLTPVAFTATRFNSEVGTAEKLLEYGRELPDEVKDITGDPATYPASASAWGFFYTPGLLFKTSSEGALRGLIQLGMGLYREAEKIRIFNFSRDYTSNNFALLVRGGIEADVTEKAAFVGTARYNWANTEGKSTSLLGFTGGVRFYF